MELLLPNVAETSNWLKESEDAFFQGLRKFSQQRENGLGYDRQGRFTGEDLCSEASFVLLRAFQAKYGESVSAWIVNSRVQTSRGVFISHFRLHVECDDDRTFFTDGTYPQINPDGPKIAFDDVTKESDYYGLVGEPRKMLFTDSNRTHILLGYFPMFFK